MHKLRIVLRRIRRACSSDCSVQVLRSVRRLEPVGDEPDEQLNQGKHCEAACADFRQLAKTPWMKFFGNDDGSGVSPDPADPDKTFRVLALYALDDVLAEGNRLVSSLAWSAC